MRLIDADALIAEIEKRRRAAKTLIGIDMVMLLGDAPTVSSWISVKERLPKVSGRYLTIDHNGLSQCLTYSAKYKAFNAFDDLENNEFIIDVEYWMTFPEPPEVNA